MSIRLRGAEPIGWLYALRLRAGKNGQLASTANVIRQALELANQSQMPAAAPVLPVEPPK